MAGSSTDGAITYSLQTRRRVDQRNRLGKLVPHAVREALGRHEVQEKLDQRVLQDHCLGLRSAVKLSLNSDYLAILQKRTGS
jgi:hypothetical protein